MMKRTFLVLAGLALIAGAYGCQGLGTGTGSSFQGGTEAGNPPTDGGFIGGTEAGNPPVGETTGGPGGGHEDPREGEDTCDIPDTPEKEGRFPCPEIPEHKVEMLSPEQMGMLHDHQEQQEADNNNGIYILDADTRKKLSGALGDFGHSEVAQPETQPVIQLPPSNGSVMTILQNLK